ncbi:non-ribosomal peptide synthetase [Pannonibacter sp. SL95]|uniref:non-ribosomal peptide synthetase n=1 Tax=Pannonibacter sp. SL95 TaxID=2995153 RepID=UPI0022739630|nr:non-ribosomal peptide synthetase [Pannonibacter sp. SL95]MCY1708680.1 amino acid adenylation domain-containing protein [Pannonibacter sp. SL95]
MSVLLEYSTELYTDHTAQDLVKVFAQLLEAAADTPDILVTDLPRADVSRQVPQVPVLTGAGAIRGRLDVLVSEQAGQTPDAVALRQDDQAMTYRVLAKRVRDLAGALHAAGLKRGDHVALMLQRSVNDVIVPLAVWRCGAVSVPIAADVPDRRLETLLKAVKCRLAVADHGIADRLTTFGVDVVSPDARGPIAPLASEDDKDVAYVMFTSGSTGAPKGVVVPHSALCNYVSWASEHFNAAQGGAHVSSSSFDLSLTNLFTPLVKGGTVEVMPHGIETLANRLQSGARFGFLSLTTSHLRMLSELLDGSGSGRADTVVLGAERVTRSDIRLAVRYCNASCVVNEYGPTETTVGCSFHDADLHVAADDHDVPIGGPISGAAMQVLDDRLQRVSSGAIGRLYVGGIGLAHGYLDQPGLTAAAFLPDPTGNGARMYDTGDRVCRLASGELQFVDRADRQLKLRGYRVEPAELEKAACDAEGVTGAYVALRSNADGSERLCLWVSGSAAEPQVRSAIAQRLPAYMTPDQVVILPVFPLTPNGKVDFAALRQVQVETELPEPVPQTIGESRVAAIWEAVLGRRPDRADANFFEAGGTSLSLVRLLVGLNEEFGIDLSFRDLMREARSLQGLVALVESAGSLQQGEAHGMPTAAEIAAIWTSQTGLSGLSENVDPFDSGASSLDASRVFAALRTRVPGLKLRDLFNERTPGNLARHIAGLSRDVCPDGGYPEKREVGEAQLTPAQQRLLWLSELFPEDTSYHVVAAFLLKGPFQSTVFEESVRAVQLRRDVLRIEIEIGETPMQRVSAGAPTPVVFHAEKISPEDLQDRIQRAARRSFALEAVPLWHLDIHPVDEDEGDTHLVILCMHHIVSDGATVRILLEEMAEQYAARLEHRAPLLQEAPSFLDYARTRQMSPAEYEGGRAYWRKRLEGHAQLIDLSDGPARPQKATFAGGERLITLSPKCELQVRQTARRTGSTVNSVLLAALAVLVGKLSGQAKFLIGVPHAGRLDAATQNLAGLLVNTVALPVEIEPATGTDLFVKQVFENLLEASDKQHIPFDAIVSDILLHRDVAVHPLFQIGFNGLGAFPETLEFGPLTACHVPVSDLTSKLDLNLYVSEPGGRLNIGLVWNKALFSDDRIDALVTQYVTVLDALCANQGSVASIALPTAPAISGRAATYEPGLLDLINQTCAARPHAPAIDHDDKKLSYGDLSGRASALSEALSRSGVGSGDRVLLLAEKHWRLPVAMLACLRLGATYCVVDAAAPAAWLSRQAGVCAPDAVVLAGGGTSHAALAALSDLQMRCGIFDDSQEGLSEGACTVVATCSPLPRNDLPVSVTFTSGSSGLPRGVVMQRSALDVFAHWYIEEFALSATDRSAVLSALGHDPLVRDILLPLAAGASVHFPSARLGNIEWLARAGVTLANVTPSRWHALAEEAGTQVESLRLLVFGGEPASPEAVKSAYRSAPNIRLCNAYGTTETAQIAAFGDAADQVLPIDAAAPGTKLKVRGIHGSPAGVGEVGELTVEGASLAMGYTGDAAQTALRFAPAENGTRVFGTGDLAKIEANGQITLLGRADDELNLFGQRVHPASIAAMLKELAEVKEVFVGSGRASDGHPVLAAWIVPGRPDLSLVDLKGAMTGVLPLHLCPQQITLVDELPKLPNGKIDRQKILQRGAANVSRNAPKRKLTGTQAFVSDLMESCLGHPVASADDDFFALGGHSLMAMRLVAGLEQHFGVKIPLLALFQDASVRGIAALIAQPESPEATKDNADAADATAPFPLTELQQAYWVGRSDELSLSTGAISYVEIACDRLDLDRFRKAWAKLIDRHDMLRAVILEDGTQKILDRVSDLPIEVLDVAGMPAAEANARMRHLREELERGAGDLSRWPLFSVAVTRDGARDTIHFGCELIIADAHSFQVIARDLVCLYRQEDDLLPRIRTSFREFVLEKRRQSSGPHGKSVREYWAGRLDAMPGPIALPYAAETDRAEAGHERITIALNARAWKALRKAAASRRLTPSGLLLAVYSEALAQHAQDQHFLLSLTLFNRPQSVDGIGEIVGDFTSVNVFEVDARLDETFQSFAVRVQQQLWSDLDHADYSGVAVQRDLARARGTLEAIPVVFTSILSNLEQDADADLGNVQYRSGRTPQVALDCIVYEQDGGLNVDWNVVRGLFYPGFIEGVQEVFRDRLVSLCDGSGWEGALLETLPASQAARRDTVNETGCSIRPQRLEAGFFAHAAAEPGRTAVADGSGSLSYGELAAAAGAVAAALGPCEGRIVGVQMEKDRWQLAAVLGILAAGGTYLPLAPDLPKPRLEEIVAQSSLDCVLTQSRLVGDLALPEHVVRLCADTLAPAAPPACLPTDTSALAYVIMTSGSTGVPKGVCMNHAAVWNTIADINSRFAIGAQDRVLSVSALTFDLSVWDVFGLLSAGGCVVFPAISERPDPEDWLQRMEQHRVTVWNAVPALMEILLSEAAAGAGGGLSGLRLALASGDVVPGDLGSRLCGFAPQAELWALGGATEAAIWSNVKAAGRTASSGAVAYGRPLSNQRFHVLDDAMRARPDHVPGEMWIGGAGLADGYLGDEQRTAERFVVHPRTGERLYRTGDLGRYLGNGDLEFLGRRDFQVKVQGHRIELGEIETALSAHADVARAVAWAPGAAGARRLLAYVVAERGAALREEDLVEHLRRQLPGYMVPSRVLLLERLPLTANGKVDRAALPEPDMPAHEAGASEANRAEATVSPLARSIAQVWSEILGRPLAAEENWFAAGGDSVAAARVATRLRAQGTNTSIRALFEHPSAIELARALRPASAENGSARETPDQDLPADLQRAALIPVLRDETEKSGFASRRISLRPRGGIFPLAPAQAAIFNAEAIADDTRLYVISVAVLLKGPLQAAPFKQALTELCERHEALRTVFVKSAGQIVQQVNAACDPDIVFDDLQALPETERQDRLAAIKISEQSREFDVAEAPPLRFRIVGLNAEEHWLCVTAHHAIIDAWSLEIMLSDLNELYLAAQEDRACRLAPASRQFGDYAAHLQSTPAGAALDSCETYWRTTLADCPAGTALPFDRLPGPVEHRTAALQSCSVSGDLLRRLSSLSGERHSSLSISLLALWCHLLCRYGNTDDVVVGLPVHGRDHPDVEGLVGCFVNMVAIRADLSGARTFEDLSERVKTRVIGALEHALMPFDQVATACDLPRERNRAPGFQTSFVMHNTPATSRGIGDLQLLAQPLETGSARTELALVVVPDGEGGAELSFKYDTALFDRATVEHIAASFDELIRQVATQPECRLADLVLAGTRPKTLVEAAALTVPEMVQSVCRNQPDALAVKCGAEELSYGELETRAASLAAALLDLGCQRETVVGVCLQDQLLIAVVHYAVWKAGAAWMPLDPTLPEERLQQLLSDSRAAVLVSDLPDPPYVSGLQILHPVHELRENLQQNLRPSAPKDLAYVMYTSGSTGQPKGVEIEHLSLATYVTGLSGRFPELISRKVGLVQSSAVDSSLTTIWGALATGRELHILDRDCVLDADSFATFMSGNEIDFLKIAPTHLRALLSNAVEPRRILPSHVLMLGGEASSQDDIAQYRRINPDLRIINHYGPTEGTIGALATWLEPDRDLGHELLPGVPLGTALPHARVDLIDRHGHPVPHGAIGEIAIGGVAAARGYLRQPSLTAERFVPDPHISGGRLYLTGDLGRRQSAGKVLFLGRRDHQVKIRGYRVEPAEIAGALVQLDGVSQAYVKAFEEPDSTWLAAFVCAPESDFDEGLLLKDLAKKLPRHMLPARIVWVDALPTTNHGKIDAKMLARPERGAHVSSEFVPPSDLTERTVAGCFERTLGVARAGLTDDFFALGGHSILAVQLLANLRALFAAPLRMLDLLRNPTVAGIASVLRSRQSDGVSRDLGAVAEHNAAERFLPFPMTEIQQAYWLGRTGEFELGNTAAHSYWEFKADGLEIERFGDALRRVIERHDMLRAIVLPAGELQVLEDVSAYEIEVTDARDGGEEAFAEACDAVREDISTKVFDLSRWPLFEVRAVIGDEGRLRLHIGVDIIIGDAWSFILLGDELARFYRDPGEPAAPLDFGFRDYVMKIQDLRAEEEYAAARDYWSERLDRLPGPPELPFVKDPSCIEFPEFDRTRITIDAEIWAKLKKRAASNGITPSTLVLTVYAESLAAHAASGHFVLNLTLFNRLPLHHAVNRLIGDFTSVTLLEINTGGTESFRDLARAVQEQLWLDLDHRTFSGVDVMRAKTSAQDGKRYQAPMVFTSVFGSEDLLPESERQSLPVELVEREGQTPQAWIDHMVVEENGALQSVWNVVRGLFYPGFIEGVQEVFRDRLVSLCDGSGWEGALLETLPASQAARRDTVNETGCSIRPQRLEAGFFAHAAAEPGRTAVADGSGSLSYGELAAAAGAVAAALGPCEGRIVGVQMEKDRWQLAAVLGILAAGGTYLPLAPDLPKPRLEEIVAQSSLDCVLTQSRLVGDLALPEHVVRLCADTLAPAAPPACLPTDTSALAYVIMTSGSTGVPKGVCMNHAAVWNTIADINSRFAIGAQDRVLSVSALTFDLSVWDVFGLLSAGGCVVFPAISERPDPEDWLQRMEQHRVTVWNAVPALMEILLSEAAAGAGGGLSGLRLALASGDVVPGDLGSRLCGFAPQAELWALGGATEAAIWSNVKAAGRTASSGAVAYGRPLSNQRFHVLDDAMRARPDHVPGEMWIGGAGLADGYLGDEQRTAERFVVHPRTGERLYRTGDLGRYLGNGDLEFLGRRDFQVKVQGHRIELGEIETALSAHADVARAVAWAPGAAGARRLLAYVVAERGAALREEDLVEHLRRQLPGYMVPSRVLLLERLPLTANGKVDRAALPEPDMPAHEAGASEANRAEATVSPLARSIAQVWSEILGRPLAAEENWFAAKRRSRCRGPCGDPAAGAGHQHQYPRPVRTSIRHRACKGPAPRVRRKRQRPGDTGPGSAGRPPARRPHPGAPRRNGKIRLRKPADFAASSGNRAVEPGTGRILGRRRDCAETQNPPPVFRLSDWRE